MVMSQWTYVNGVIKVDTFSRSSAETLYLVQTVVDHLPVISGSERNVEYYINLAKSMETSSSVDEFNNFSNLYNDRHFRCFNWQTYALIALNGYLRDRDFETTLRETTRMLARLSSRLWVDECLVSVRDGYNCNSFVFNNPNWIKDMDRSDWCRDLLRSFSDGQQAN